jgi:hypothetical protein
MIAPKEKSMRNLRINLIATIFALALLLTGCSLGSFGPPASCGDNIGGTADVVRFDQYFTRMVLVNQNGEAGPEGENGMEFTSTDTLELRANSNSVIAVRACIQNFNGRPIAFDGTQTFTQGSSGFSLGSFQSGNYVVRVIVDGTEKTDTAIR